MATLATLVVNLTANAAGFFSEMNKAESRTSKILGGMGRNVQTLGKAALGGLSVVAGATTAAGAGFLKLAVDAAPIEGVRSSFEGLTSTVEGGSAGMLAALEEGSAGMIAQRDLMMKFNQAAGLVSKDFAVQLPEAMQYLSKVAASTGQDMDYMLSSLVVGVGRLSPNILDNLNIQASLAEATSRAAGMFGVEEKALTKAQTQVGMMSVVMEKLAANTADMPDVSDSAAAGIARMQAKFKNFKDQAGMALLPVLNILLGIFGRLTDAVLPPLVTFFETSLAPALEGLMNTFGGLFDAVMAGEADLSTLKAVLEGLLPPDVVDAVMGLVTGLQDLYATVAPIISQVVGWVSQFVSWKDVLIALGIAIGSVVVPMIVSLIASIAPLILTAVALVAAIAVVRRAWENDWGGIRTKVLEVIGNIRPAVDAVLNAISTFWSKHGSNILQIASNTWNSIQTIIKFVINTILNIINLILQILAGDWEGAWETIKGIAADFWEAISTLFVNSLDNILRIFGTTLADMYEAAKTKFQEIKDAITGLMQSIQDYLSGIDLGEIGAAIMNSLKEGIMSRVQSIIDAVRRAVERIIQEAREALDILSPSHVFVEMGQAISEGLAMGIDEAAQLPVASTRGMMSGVVGAGGAGMGGGGMIVLAPVFLDPREVMLAGGEVDYAAIGKRLMQLQEGI